MVITTTAIGFLVLTIGLAICGAWFMRAFRKSGGLKSDNKIGFLLSLLFIVSAAQNALMGVALLFFTVNPEKFYIILAVDHALLSGLSMLSIYTAYYIFSPKHSPILPVMATGLLGAVTVSLSIVTQPKPFMTIKNGIDLNMNLQLSLLTFCLLFIALATIFYIFIRVFLIANTKALKNLSLVVSALAGMGIINLFIRFVLLHGADSSQRTSLFDLGITITGIVFIAVLAVGPIIKELILNKK